MERSGRVGLCGGMKKWVESGDWKDAVEYGISVELILLKADCWPVTGLRVGCVYRRVEESSVVGLVFWLEWVYCLSSEDLRREGLHARKIENVEDERTEKIYIKSGGERREGTVMAWERNDDVHLPLNMLHLETFSYLTAASESDDQIH